MSKTAARIFVAGVVQGVGFRPFVYRLASRHRLCGWVRNGAAGVEIHIEGRADAIEAFAAELVGEAPPAARVSSVRRQAAQVADADRFEIIASGERDAPTTRISPDLPACDACLAEMRDPANRRHGYPFVNCTDCGPRYSIITGLPYDRPLTTMRDWPLCDDCRREYDDPADRRFHAQPTACPKCGPTLRFVRDGQTELVGARECIAASVALLSSGGICAVKGLGGYHLACDARCASAVEQLRRRKYRKEKPFAVMTRDLDVAGELVELTDASAALLQDVARPIVLARARVELPHVAPGNDELGVMLPYTPLHCLLFDAGAPAALVMTSANQSNEPLCYEDDDALRTLVGVADAFLIGERPIARRVDDSVARVGVGGPLILRRARGYAPAVVAQLPNDVPLLAVGPDLKNTITLVVDGQAVMSQFVGDLAHSAAARAFEQTASDLLSMYDLAPADVRVAHDLHPEYASTRFAQALPGPHVGVQHHRAHIAAVLAERDAPDATVVGLAFDGTGFGDDGTIWGGEVFVGSGRGGLQRVAHLRPAKLPGGDAAAQFPAQAAAGFVAELDGRPDLTAPPFNLPPRYAQALELVQRNVRTFVTTSMGRLFDTAAALAGFDREISFEGQAAIWLEQLARRSDATDAYDFPALDYRPLLRTVIADRRAGRPVEEIARAFHRGVARGAAAVAAEHATRAGADAVVLSGGVFQNAVLMHMLVEELARIRPGLPIWTHMEVPPNDSGVSLGQAALATWRP